MVKYEISRNWNTPMTHEWIWTERSKKIDCWRHGLMFLPWNFEKVNVDQLQDIFSSMKVKSSDEELNQGPKQSTWQPIMGFKYCIKMTQTLEKKASGLYNQMYMAVNQVEASASASELTKSRRTKFLNWYIGWKMTTMSLNTLSLKITWLLWWWNWASKYTHRKTGSV